MILAIAFRPSRGWRREFYPVFWVAMFFASFLGMGGHLFEAGLRRQYRRPVHNDTVMLQLS